MDERVAGGPPGIAGATGPPTLTRSPSPPVASTPAPAGFWRRFLASLIDAILVNLACLFMLLALGFVAQTYGEPPENPERGSSDLVAGLTMLFGMHALLNCWYFAAFEASSWQATPGKRALGLMVTDLSGGRVSTGRASGRYFARYVSAIALGIGYLIQPFTAKRQALHDIIAGTLVVLGEPRSLALPDGSAVSDRSFAPPRCGAQPNRDSMHRGLPRLVMARKGLAMTISGVQNDLSRRLEQYYFLSGESDPSRFNWRKPSRVTTVLLVLLVLAGTWLVNGYSWQQGPDTRFTFRMVTGTENRALVPMLEEFAEQEDVTIEFTHQGSVDTMLELQAGAAEYDAVWPASSIWLSLGDTQGVVQRETSIMATPVVFAVKRSIAESLGWIDRDVRVEEIMAAAESGQIRYMTTSATQSNSGAMAYLGYLYAFAGQPEVLTSEMLHDPVVIEQTTRILGLVDRSAGASGFLRDLFLQQYDQFDGMFNNESAVITANQQLVADGREPLYVIYPVDGLGIADWPLGFIDRGDEEKSEFFDKFQAYLLSEDVQRELLAQGRRTGLGLNPVGADPAVFNPEWGIDLELVIQPINLPPADVILEALNLYQTEFRKPSFTVYCLDYSGSMRGSGEEELEAAMAVLLDPGQSAHYLLQPSSRDVTVVIPFNEQTIDLWQAEGNDPATLRRLLNQVTAQAPDGSTNIYTCVARALDLMEQAELEGYEPAIVLMTDGRSREGSFDDIEEQLAQSSLGTVPVYGILFGDASDDQLNEIADATSGRVFDGRDDLVGALRDARANN